MIVGNYFYGDDDTVIARAQHDVYGDSLGIIVQICNRYANAAKLVSQTDTHQDWGTTTSFDHRTLQLAHDLLAAAWRFKVGKQLDFEFRGERQSKIDGDSWLRWLREEITEWIHEPSLVKSVQDILANQNSQIGYRAEATLCISLLDRFPDIPWHARLRDALENDLAKIGMTNSKLDESNQEDKPMTTEEAMDEIIPTSVYDAIEIARQKIFSELRLQVYEVLEPDDPKVAKLPLPSYIRRGETPCWPPSDCWVILCNASLSHDEQLGCGGDVRVICVSKSTGTVVFDDEYSEE